jgi:hypothetical protein
MGTLEAFSPGPRLASGGPRTGRGPWESRAFVEDFRPPHPSTGAVHAVMSVVRQDPRARLHGDAPWRRVG